MEPYLADKRVLQKSKEYDLFGVVYHHGAVFGGHYVATSRLSSYNCEKLPGMYVLTCILHVHVHSTWSRLWG